MAKKPLVSIIIPTHAYTSELKKCLQSVLNNTKINFELIVVCVFSSPTEFSQFSQVQFIKTKQERGPAKNRNIGVNHSTDSKYLVFLDSDTVVGKNWLQKTIKYLDNHLKVGAGQLKLLKSIQRNRFDSAGEKITPFGFLVERARSAKDIGQFDQAGEIFGGKAAAMIARKKVFNQVGGFDPDYFIYWEEEDFCWRVWKSGYKVVFLPWSKVWHAYDQRIGEINKNKQSKLTYYGCRNHLLTILKNGIGLSKYVMLFSVALSWLVLFILFSLRGDFHRSKSVVKAFRWLISNKKLIDKKRQKLIKKLGSNFYSDPNWFKKVTTNRGLYWYLGKAISYILGKPF